VSSQELFPTNFLKLNSWYFDEKQSGGDSRDGNGWVVELGTGLWMVTLRYENLTDAAMRALTAFVARRRGKAVTCTIVRTDRKAPLMAPSMTNSGLTVNSIDEDAKTVTMSGLGSNAISSGDMLSYKTNMNGFFIGEITADATPSSGVATLHVNTPPITPHASAPAPRLREAYGEFMMEGPPEILEPFDRRRIVGLKMKQVVRRVA
jgi:hypothetical protein